MEQAPVDTRIDNTARELQKWVEQEGVDESTLAQAEFITETVLAWQNGLLSGLEANRALYLRYFSTEDRVSEGAGVMLMQAASLWFPYEAGIGHDENWTMRGQAIEQVGRSY